MIIVKPSAAMSKYATQKFVMIILKLKSVVARNMMTVMN